MLPRTDLIVSYKPLPHVARSAIIEKNHFCTRESPEIIVRGKLETLAGGREEKGAIRGYIEETLYHAKLQKIRIVSRHRSIWSIDNIEFSKNTKDHKDHLSVMYAMGGMPALAYISLERKVWALIFLRI